MRFRLSLWTLVTCAGVGLNPVTMSQAADWGDVKARFVFVGDVPDRPVLQVNKDPEFCGKFEPRSDKLIVHKTDRGLANVIVWLETKANEQVPVHESYADAATAKVKLANKGCRFEPHVCVMRTGQSLVIENPDRIAHNTAAGLDRNDPFNFVTAPGQSVERGKLTLSERMPAGIQCAIHPWMLGWLVVKDHPYVAVSDEHGRIELKHLPAGERTLTVWHEVPTLVSEVTRGGQREAWKRGRVTVDITPQGINLGEIKLAADLFR